MHSLDYGIGILGIGAHLPERVLSNADLEKMVDTSNEWIVQRTGISERRILEHDIPAYEMGVHSSQQALKNAGVHPDEVDLIIATTFAPDYFSPATASNIQREIGAKNAAAFDLNAACTGFVYGISVGQQFIASGMYEKVLVVSVEANSRVIDWSDRGTCILFGDGSGAVLLGKVEKGSGILETKLYSDGEGAEFIKVPATYNANPDASNTEGKNTQVIQLDGSEVMKFAVRSMVSSIESILEKAGISSQDLNLLVPHQANIRIIEGAIKRLEIPKEKVFMNIHKYGNMSSASIPIALFEAYRENRLKKDDLVAIVGFGGGLTWGASLLRWSIS